MLLGLVLLTVQAGNVGHLDQDSEQSAKYWEFDQPIPVSAQRPVSVLYVALGPPYETARRYVGRLIKFGDIVRLGKGLVTPTQGLTTRGTFEQQSQNAANLRQFVRRLKACGFSLDD